MVTLMQILVFLLQYMMKADLDHIIIPDCLILIIPITLDSFSRSEGTKKKPTMEARLLSSVILFNRLKKLLVNNFLFRF